MTADWPEAAGANATNSAVIWDAIITNPSADHLMNIGPIAKKKLRKSAEGKTIDPSRCVVGVFAVPPGQLLTRCYSGLLKLKNQKPKYQITHPSGKIGQAGDVALRVHYNVQPWVGLLTWNMDKDVFNWKAMAGGLSEKFVLPAVKSKDDAKNKGKRS